MTVLKTIKNLKEIRTGKNGTSPYITKPNYLHKHKLKLICVNQTNSLSLICLRNKHPEIIKHKMENDDKRRKLFDLMLFNVD